jgi:hypothetical protein
MTGFFTEPEQALDHIHDLLQANKGELGIQFVGYADETILPKYPAVVVSFNTPVTREIATLRQFTLTFNVQLIIYHARLTASHKTRAREDMQLAARVRDKLHEDHSMGGGVIFGYVVNEVPAITADDKGRANIATTLVWQGESRKIF